MKTFVVMPFAPEFDDIYNFGIKTGCKEIGFTSTRLDEQIFEEGMLEKIYKEISSAELIIAELSDKNPNVFYELGYAHAIGKRCILLTQNVDNIPFDLKHKRHIIYKNLTDLKPKLLAELKYHFKQIEESKNTAISAEVNVDGEIDVSNGYAKIVKINVLMDLHNISKQPIRNINSIILYFGNRWELNYNGEQLTASKSDLENYNYRYYLKSPAPSLAKSGWMQMRFSLQKLLAYKSDDGYNSIKTKVYSGFILMKIATDNDTYEVEVPMQIKVEEGLPF